MVQKILNEQDIKEMCQWLEEYDITGKFPFDKVRIDITISKKSLVKLEGMNKSKVIDNLILEMK